MDIRRISECSTRCRVLATLGLAAALVLVTIAYIQAVRPSMDEGFARFTISRIGQTAGRLDIEKGVHGCAVAAGWIDLDANLFLGSTSASRTPEAARLVDQLRTCYRASLDVWQASLGGREPVPVGSVHGLAQIVAADPPLQALVVATPSGPALSNQGDQAVLRMWQYAGELAGTPQAQ
ncbi:MAG: hypothetical protein FDZ75_01235 [Actinobacteria bacterium]|nr:MAG: hypothetical protein FDZ75_01235 [Actinomycetota bacterium]